MDNQNLNNELNNNNSTSVNNFNTDNNVNIQNNMNTTSNNVEVLDDSIESNNNFNSFIKPPEIKPQNTNDLLNSVPKPDMMVSAPASNSISSEDLIREYVGKNYDKISTKEYNIAAFLLGGTYLIYRKMYLLGLLINIVAFIVALFASIISPILSSVIFFIISIALCLTFNKFYIKNAKNKIEKIKDKNTNKSVEELKQLCAKKGGTNIILTIVLSLVTVILMFLIMFLMAGYLLLLIGDTLLGTLLQISQNNVVVENNDNNTTNIIDNEDQDDTTYNGVINYDTSIKINDKVTMGYLQVFTPSTLNSEYSINYEYQDKNVNTGKCSFRLSVVNGYDSSINLINEMANYHNSNNSVSTLTTPSNYVWNTFEISEDLKTTYYNSIVNNDLVYLLEYNIDSNANKAICDAFYKGVINSINFK